MTENEFEPRIVVFACNWCSYAGADLAGVSRIQYPPTIRIIRVMCSSRVDPAFILKAFLKGADGVLVAGCHLGDCHYIEGNYNTEKRIKQTMKALEYVGFEPKRLRLEWISASEGPKFAGVVREFTEELKKLGPNPMRKPGEDVNG
jgi:F420-non-reducing hydrogenase iron-sulfur subunit